MNNLPAPATAPAIKVCDNKSVGVFIFYFENTLLAQDGRLLLIERATFPWGWTIPAGHLDGEVSYAKQACVELEEEVGLTFSHNDLSPFFLGRLHNKCRREQGDFHDWEVYTTVTSRLDVVRCNPREVKNFCWVGKAQLQELRLRAEQRLAGKISDEEWQSDPGLEPLTLEWLKLRGLQTFLQSLR